MNTPPARPAPLLRRAFPVLLTAFALLLLAPACRRPAEVADHASLRLTTRELEPASRFELLLDTPAVPASAVGQPGAVSPLQVEPDLPGQFVWRSRRSGLFTPSAPLRLGTTYTFTLRDDLQTTNGQPHPARLRRAFATPGLEVELRPETWWNDDDLPVLPVVLVAANAPLSATDLAQRARFHDGQVTVPAEVEPWLRTNQPSFGYPGATASPTWLERFSITNAPTETGAHYRLRPVRPLSSTQPWRLEIAAGLRGQATPLRLPASVQLPLGKSEPFAIRELHAANTVSGGRRLQFRFSRTVSPSVLTNAATHWCRVDPPVAHLAVTPDSFGRYVAVSGDFALGQGYRVTVATGLPAAQPLTLAEPFQQTVRFEPITPAVWLAEFNTVQLATGRRDLDLLAINTPEARLRMKALDRHTLIHTLRAYERYFRSATPYSPDTVPGGALDFPGIPGRTCLDTNFNLSAPVDHARTLTLSWDALTGPGSRGAYFIEVDLHGLPPNPAGNQTRVGPQGLVQLTDLGFAVKAAEAGTHVWVFSHSQAQPVAGALVSLRSNDNEVLAEGRSDAQGLVRLPTVPAAAWVLVEFGNDLHAERLGSHEVPLWTFNLPGRGDPGVATRLFPFTDREAYRPGETLQLQLLARTWDGETWQLPTNRTVALELVGPRGDTTLRTNLLLSDTGASHWTWRVPTGTRGTYRAKLSGDGPEAELEFEVRDFQPAAFEIQLGVRPEYGPEVPLTIPVTAHYLFGQSLSRARVLWHATATDSLFRPETWPAFEFGRIQDDWRFAESTDTPGEATAQGTAELTATNAVVLSPELPFHTPLPRPQLTELRVEVTDLNQQTLAQSVEFLRHPSDFYLGFRWSGGQEALLFTNQPLDFQVVAVRTDGQPWTHSVPVQARLRRVTWQSVATLRAGQVIGYQNEPEYRELARQTFTNLPAIQIGKTWDVAAELHHTLPAVTEPGAYLLELTAQDPGGRPVITSVGFHVAGDGQLAWHRQNGSRLELLADRERYQPGETATLLVKAPFSGTAWVTVEREGVRRSFTTELRGQAPSLSVPLEAHDAPNVFVSVTLVRGIAGNPHEHPMPEWRVGYLNLPVAADADRLQVEVSAQPAVPAPGDMVTAEVVVRDSNGRPVTNAEVTLYAVDEGYLLLKGTEVPDPSAAFGAFRGLHVTTTLPLPGLHSEDPELRQFGNKGHLAGGGGRADRPRDRFVPCPLWEPTLRTDEAGRVTARFPAPDSLTRFRVVAVATHGATRFGSAHSQFEVRKPLMIESALPRFGHVGDQLQARGLVFNQTDQAQSVKVTFQPPKQVRLSAGVEPTQTLSVPAQGTAVVEFATELLAPGTGRWSWQATAGALSDTVSVELSVTHAAPVQREVRHLRVPATGTNLLADLDPAVLEHPESVTVRVASSHLALLGEGTRYLLHYPYGCVEQTGSSLLPWIALRDQPGLLPPDLAAPTNTARALQAGVQRFWSMQTSDGGLAYWPGGSSPQRWGSAYAAWILALARDAGAEVAPQRLERLHAWLDQEWRKDPPQLTPEVLHLRCLTAFALAAGGTNPPALLQALLADRDRLSTEDRALLAAAVLQSGGERATAASLLDQAPAAGDTAGQFGDRSRTLALQLLVRTRLDPADPRTEALTTRLLAGQHGGHWATTQGNAWSLWALTELARRQGVAQTWNGELTLGTHSHALAPSTEAPVATWQSPVSAAELQAGLLFRHHASAPLYIEITVVGRPGDTTRLAAAVDHGFQLQRRYERLDDQNHPGPADSLQVGDRVLVTLQIDAPEAGEWLALEDPLPAVLEPVQGAFKTDSALPADLIQPWTEDFREVRSDRIWFFRNDLPEGRHVIRYLARVRAAGDVVAAPAKLEAMYEPERHGFSAGARLRARAR